MIDKLYVLPSGWEWKTLDECTELITKGTTPTTNGYKFLDKGINFLKIENIVNGEINLSTIEMFISEEAHQSQKRSQLKENDVLFSIAGTIGDTAIVNKEHLPMNTNQAIALIRPKEFLNSLFLKYSLLSIVSQNTKDKQRGGAIKNISLGDIKELTYPLPPLLEQQRLVKKIDSLFEKIDKSIELHQKNINEANAIMGSVLNEVFVEMEEKYGLKQIAQLFKIRSGDFLPKKNMIESGNIDVYGGNGINGCHNDFNLSGENILIGRVGALCGNVRCVNGNVWLTDNAFYVSEFLEEIDKKYLTQMLIHIDLGSSANQSAQPVISYKGISELKLPLPPLPIQQKVVEYLDSVSQKMEKVKSIQKEKMVTLKALKASILDKAFRGEL